MAIFRSRAIDAANEGEILNSPLVLLRPQPIQNFKNNLKLWLELNNLRKRSNQVCTKEHLQQDPTECAAVSLSIILSYYGCHKQISEVRHACGVSRDGSNAANLVRAARTFGLNAKGFKKGLKTLESVSLPAVVFWNFNHFLVLEGTDNGRYWINDPANGRRCLDLQEFDRCYTGVVITMQPDASFRQTRKPRHPIHELGHWLSRGSKTKRWSLLLSLGVSAVLISQTTQLITTPELWPLIGLALAVIPMGKVVSTELEYQLRKELQKQLLSLPEWILQQHFSHELAGRLQRVTELSAQLRLRLGRSFPLVLGMTIWLLGLIVHNTMVGMVLLLGLLLWGVVQQRNAYTNSSSNLRSRISQNKTAEILQAGLKDPATLKASALEQDLFLRSSGLDALATRQRQALDYRRELQDWFPQWLYWSLPVFAWSLASTAQDAGLTVIIGTFGLCVTLQDIQTTWRTWVASKRDINAIRDLKEQSKDPLITTANDTNENLSVLDSASVSLEEVSFGYIPVLPPLIQDLNIKIRKGQRVALVGNSASGKSTVARLIAGLLQPTEGAVKINEQSLLELSQQERTRAIAMVQQGMPLLSTTLRNNLSLFDPNISDEEIQIACEIAAIWEQIEQLPNGLDTTIGRSGPDLSGGEKQRLQLAQALLQKPSVLILDEATSALDAQTEARIEQAIKRLSCTQIVIAHRLSTVRDADEIVVLDHGRIVQQGSHNMLAKEEGSPYHNLLLLEESSDKTREEVR